MGVLNPFLWRLLVTISTVSYRTSFKIFIIEVKLRRIKLPIFISISMNWMLHMMLKYKEDHKNMVFEIFEQFPLISIEVLVWLILIGRIYTMALHIKLVLVLSLTKSDSKNHKWMEKYRQRALNITWRTRCTNQYRKWIIFYYNQKN